MSPETVNLLLASGCAIWCALAQAILFADRVKGLYKELMIFASGFIALAVFFLLAMGWRAV